jgi:hypothetical protein
LDLQDCYSYLNLWINKQQGVFYSFPQLDLLTDRGQMSLYATYYPQAGTSEDIADSLSPFKKKYNFSLVDSPAGVVTYPDDLQDVLDVEMIVLDSNNIPRARPCPFLNEDERTARKNSQVIPLTTWDPFAENLANGFQLWPAVPQAGVLSYYKRPAKPFYAYTLVSGRVPIYNPATSTQLEWFEKDQNLVLILALQSIGINTSEVDIQQFAEMKAQQAITTKNKF